MNTWKKRNGYRLIPKKQRKLKYQQYQSQRLRLQPNVPRYLNDFAKATAHLNAAASAFAQGLRPVMAKAVEALDTFRLTINPPKKIEQVDDE